MSASELTLTTPSVAELTGKVSYLVASSHNLILLAILPVSDQLLSSL